MTVAYANLRTASFIVTAGGIVASRFTPHLLVLVAVSAIALASQWPHRLLAGVLAGLLLAGAPWPLPAFGALGVVAVVRRVMSRAPIPLMWKPLSDGRLSIQRAAVAVLVGLSAGCVTLIIAHTQLSGNPQSFKVERPATAVVISLVIATSLGNSIGEELLWRRAMLTRLFREAPGLWVSAQAV